ncbi:MAG: hypothetical protein WCG97_02705 [bacterium]
MIKDLSRGGEGVTNSAPEPEKTVEISSREAIQLACDQARETFFDIFKESPTMLGGSTEGDTTWITNFNHVVGVVIQNIESLLKIDEFSAQAKTELLQYKIELYSLILKSEDGLEPSDFLTSENRERLVGSISDIAGVLEGIVKDEVDHLDL